MPLLPRGWIQIATLGKRLLGWDHAQIDILSAWSSLTLTQTLLVGDLCVHGWARLTSFLSRVADKSVSVEAKEKFAVEIQSILQHMGLNAIAESAPTPFDVQEKQKPLLEVLAKVVTTSLLLGILYGEY